MNAEKDKYISPEEFEVIQDSYECKVEYDNGNIIMHSDTSNYHNGDSYVSSVFPKIKIDLKDIF